MSHSALNAHFLAFIGKACQSLLYRTAFGTFLGQLSCIFFPVLVCSELVWILSPLSILFHQLYVGWNWTENVDVIIFILISLGSTEGGLSREWEGRAGLNWPSTGHCFSSLCVCKCPHSSFPCVQLLFLPIVMRGVLSLWPKYLENPFVLTHVKLGPQRLCDTP